jgi:hypothetical protein
MNAEQLKPHKAGNSIERLNGYIERRYGRPHKMEIRKASKDAWRTFCNFVKDLPMSARFHRAFSRDCKIELGSLLAPSGRCTQSKGETLGLLLVTHFPKLVVTKEVAAPAADGCTRHLDWQVVGRVVTYRRVEWTLILLLHTKD